MNITTIHNERKRGCGYRKQGGMYLMAGEPDKACGKLPLPLVVCPCCGQGIKQARGWTWINAQKLFEGHYCNSKTIEEQHLPCSCILSDDNLPEKMGLLWVGEKFYRTADEFLAEGFSRGVSRRINQIPHGFELGKTWVAFAHPKGFEEIRECPACDQAGTITDENGQHVCEECEGKGMVKDFSPAIFGVFRPTRIEYIVKDDDTDEKLQRLEKRGFTLIRLTWDPGKGPKTEDPEEESEAEADQHELFSDQILEDQERSDFAHDRDEDNISAADIL